MTPTGSAQADIAAPRRARVAALLLVTMLHVVAVLALIRAFAPDFTARVADNVVATFTVTVSAPPPPPPPVAKLPDPAGAAAPAGRKAEPKAVAAPVPKVVLVTRPAPKVAGEGDDVRSGARDQGDGTGAGGAGSGTGAGTGGSGQGGGGTASRATKLAGDINSARDYPKTTRAQRRGDYVIVALTVGTDGRVKTCRVHRASSDPQADQITCRLAAERFRFRPATDAAGNPVSSIYGWQQRWFDPRETD